ncbi:DNA-binding MarR family transcriptional regulator [Nocardioides cavernae]|uniref:DNA-binding MarR family transcriptional regulator n=1 Tax=Nocardioides cavernae TaxID=1921566 RepID=A0A7Y9H0A0_9ACTN|nr:MarR family transcriptional regulator [Nocardioides cavernae]NYE35558.1 DNA-binding MarR family transcriptional regulator [Nocardioides cavernae]
MPSQPADHDAFAELADLLLNVGRLVRARTPSDAAGVPLSETERTVMRLVDLFPGSSPSDIAERGRLQRSNVSAALRTLEDKGMVERTSTSGRGVAVHATDLADRNLAALRAAWGRELALPLADDVDAVRRCVALLTRLEGRLIDADPQG